ncbi:MAG: hypothetical protein HN873_03915 [Chloroflexi bacterium]|nr:hypothetical protein [Chloroflexota bacterium]
MRKIKMPPKSKKPNTIKINSNQDIILIGNNKYSFAEWENGSIELIHFINSSYLYNDYIKDLPDIIKIARQIPEIFGTTFRNDPKSYVAYYYLLKEKPEVRIYIPNYSFLDITIDINYDALACLCFYKDEITIRKDKYISKEVLKKYYYQFNVGKKKDFDSWLNDHLDLIKKGQIAWNPHTGPITKEKIIEAIKNFEKKIKKKNIKIIDDFIPEVKFNKILLSKHNYYQIANFRIKNQYPKYWKDNSWKFLNLVDRYKILENL